MNKTEFIRWYRSTKNTRYVSDFGLSDAFDEIYESAWQAGYTVGLAENIRIVESSVEEKNNE